VFDSYLRFKSTLAVLPFKFEEQYMPATRDNREKAEAIHRLLNNMGDVSLTAKQTDIPERTLYEWKNEFRDRKNSFLLQYTAINKHHQAIHEQYVFIRDDIITHLYHLSQRLRKNPENPTQLAAAFARLVDRLVKAEALVQQTTTYAIIILWEHPDGTVHDKPVWERITPPESESS
jgi:transposase-like protein